MIPIDAESATRTTTQRRGEDVWDLSLTRGRETPITYSLTLSELRRTVLRAELQLERNDNAIRLAKHDQVPPPPEEDPPTDPPWSDIVTPAEEAHKATLATLADLNYLVSVLVGGGVS